MNAKELSDRMRDRAEDIARHLLPNGKRKGREWKVGSIGGEEGESLCVCVSGQKAGVWSDFQSGEAGDLLDLWMKARGMTLPDAMKEAADFLGIRDTMPGNQPKRTYTRPERPQGAKRAQGRVLEWLTGRGLTPETIAAFKVAELARGSSVYALFAYLLPDGSYVNGKYRNIDDKKDMRQEKDAEPHLFGWHLVDQNARRLVICEGEVDAMSLYQVGIRPVLSVNQGAGNHQWIESDWERLEQFSDIVVCFDNDEAGEKGAREVMTRLGLERCRRMRVGHGGAAVKDANDWLRDGADGSDFDAALQDAKPLDPEELRSADDYTAQVELLIHPPEGAPTDPSLELDKAVTWFYFRRGEYTCWTGINGHGKSLMLDQILLGLMYQGERIAIFSGEMPPGKHLERMHRQATGLRRPSKAYIRAVGTWLRDRCWIFDLVGIARLDRLLEVFAYAAKRYGIRHFVIDSLMMIDVPADGPGSITKQNEAVQKIVAFKKAHDAHFHLVAHPRKTRDELQEPGKMDVAGAGGIVNGADNVFSIWRASKDKAPPIGATDEEFAQWQEKQNGIDAKLVLKKSRYGTHQEYTWSLWFDEASMQYRSQARNFPRRYVEFSQEQTE